MTRARLIQAPQERIGKSLLDLVPRRIVAASRFYHQQADFHPPALRHAARHALSFARTKGSVFHGCCPSIS
jgi:hypothetical protein